MCSKIAPHEGYFLRRERKIRSEVEEKFSRLIGQFVREVRLELGVKSSTVARHAALHDKSHLGKFERGAYTMDLFRFVMIANVFGVTAVEMMVRFTVFAAERGVSIDAIPQRALDFLKEPEWRVITPSPTDPI